MAARKKGRATLRRGGYGEGVARARARSAAGRVAGLRRGAIRNRRAAAGGGGGGG